MRHTDSLHEINLQHLTAGKPDQITGVASVIDGDTIEVHGSGSASTASTRRRASNTATTPRGSNIRAAGDRPKRWIAFWRHRGRCNARS